MSKCGEGVVKNKILVVIWTFLLLGLMACQEKKSDISQKQGLYEVANQSSCVACHTDKALLTEVAEPLGNTGGDTGEG